MSVRRVIASHVALLKVNDCVFCSSKFTRRFPSCLLIFLPLNPVLDSILLDLLVKDYFDFVFLLTFNDVGQWLILELLPWEKLVAACLKTLLLNIG